MHRLQIIVIDVARLALEAEGLEDTAEVRGDPGIDLGIRLLPLGHSRFHLLEIYLERGATPAEGQLGLGHAIRAAAIGHVELDEVCPTAVAEPSGRVWDSICEGWLMTAILENLRPTPRVIDVPHGPAFLLSAAEKTSHCATTSGE
jgi:hypothetical protein